MSITEFRLDPNLQKILVTRATAQIRMLTAMFLLGMVVNLIGMSSATSSIAKITYNISLVLHILIGIGLLVGSIVMVRPARQAEPGLGRLAWAGLALIAGTFVTGVLAMELDNDWWSFIMSVGFMASFLVYGYMLIQSLPHASKEL
jgi:hypothetical protein